MKKLIVIISMLFFSGAASAQWATSTEDDIFTGGKKATMVASLGDYSTNALIFDCTKNDLTFAYVEPSNEPEKVTNIPVEMVVKVDSGDIKKMQSGFGQRNDKYIEVSVSDRDIITQILKEASKAKSKMVVGISGDEIGQHSVTANVSGSGKAINKFSAACEISLK